MDMFIKTAPKLPMPKYDYITTDEQAKAAINEISKYPLYSLDTETTGLDPYLCKLTLLQIGVGNKSFVFDMRNDTDQSSVDLKTVDTILQTAQIKILQNAVFDSKVLKIKRNLYMPNMYDTMLAEQLLHLGLNIKADLASLVYRYLGLAIDKEPRSTFQDYGQKYEPFQLEYAARDVTPLETIRDLQLLKLNKEGLERVAELEFDFIKPMCEMELNGIHIDIKKLRSIMALMEEKRVKANKTITSILTAVDVQTTLFGVSLINIDSNSQLKKALNRYGLQLDSTSVEALEKYSGIEIIDSILDYRKVQKLISTYGESLIGKLHSTTGKLHTHFRQMVSTGRLSSSNPNLQNMPHDQLFRSCFVAKEGYSLVTSDMSSCELCILGNLSKDKIFIEAFKNGKDLHKVAAALVFKVDYEKVTKQQRSAAKAIQFGLCLSEDTDVITNYGVKKIQNVEVGEIIPHDEGINEVIGKAYMGKKEVFEIETRYGYTLEATSDHLVKVIDSSGKYVDKKLIDVDINSDYICLKSNTNFFPNNDFIFDTFKVERKTNYKHFNLPKKMDNRMAEFLGLFVSEGSVISVRNRNKYSSLQFSFSDKEPGFIKKIDELLNYLFNNRLVRLHKDGAIRYKFNSVLFCEWLAHICNIKKNTNKTNNICIPECVKQSSKKIQISFLKWLFEGDGSVKQNGKGYAITYSSKSFKLVKDVQLMLLNFGILSSIRGETRKNYPGEIYYEIRLVSYKSRLNFVNNIGFVTKYKNNKCIDNCNSRQSVYFLPNQINRLNSILTLINKQKCKTNELYDIIYNAKNRKTGIGSIHFKKLSKYDPLVKFIYENDIVPLPIKSIKLKGIKKVYDLSIKDHPYFLANGFVVHNCYGLSKYGLAKRLKISDKEADKMIKDYFKNYKGIKNFLDESGRNGVKYRYSRSISGRKRYYTLPDYNSKEFKMVKKSIERQSKNMTIQSANVDVIKKAMIILCERLKPYDAKLILTVHDEVVVEVIDSQKIEVAEIVSQSMIDGFAEYFSIIPVESDSITGPCWIKDKCDCGCDEMKFIDNKKYNKQLVCTKCGANQQGE